MYDKIKSRIEKIQAKAPLPLLIAIAIRKMINNSLK